MLIKYKLTKFVVFGSNNLTNRNNSSFSDTTHKNTMEAVNKDSKTPTEQGITLMKQFRLTQAKRPPVYKKFEA